MNNQCDYPKLARVQDESVQFMAQVYRWMTTGMVVTGLSSYAFSQNLDSLQVLVSGRWPLAILLMAQFGSIFILSSRIRGLSAFATTCVFLAYAALTGVTLSTLLVHYSQDAIQTTFFTTALAFFGLGLFGTVTKKDLGPLGNFCAMGLFGLLGFGVLSLIFPSLINSVTGPVSALVGLIVFSGLTAYDTQKIKNSYGAFIFEDQGRTQMAIRGALTLYLDFINLFLHLLRLLGGRRK